MLHVASFFVTTCTNNMHQQTFRKGCKVIQNQHFLVPPIVCCFSFVLVCAEIGNELTGNKLAGTRPRKLKKIIQWYLVLVF